MFKTGSAVVLPGGRTVRILLTDTYTRSVVAIDAPFGSDDFVNLTGEGGEGESGSGSGSFPLEARIFSGLASERRWMGGKHGRGCRRKGGKIREPHWHGLCPSDPDPELVTDEAADADTGADVRWGWPKGIVSIPGTMLALVCDAQGGQGPLRVLDVLTGGVHSAVVHPRHPTEGHTKKKLLKCHSLAVDRARDPNGPNGWSDTMHVYMSVFSGGHDIKVCKWNETGIIGWRDVPVSDFDRRAIPSISLDGAGGTTAPTVLFRKIIDTETGSMLGLAVANLTGEVHAGSKKNLFVFDGFRSSPDLPLTTDDHEARGPKATFADQKNTSFHGVQFGRGDVAVAVSRRMHRMIKTQAPGQEWHQCPQLGFEGVCYHTGDSVQMKSPHGIFLLPVPEDDEYIVADAVVVNDEVDIGLALDRWTLRETVGGGSYNLTVQNITAAFVWPQSTPRFDQQ